MLISALYILPVFLRISLAQPHVNHAQHHNKRQQATVDHEEVIEHRYKEVIVTGSSISSGTNTNPLSGRYSDANYPFSRVVAFGDNLSDNGNGSYAYKVSKDPGVYNTIYGYKTWTDHQVAVSYLVDLLGIPLTQDFAFGHAWGGAEAGATVDDTNCKTPEDPPYFPTQFSSPSRGASSSKVQIQDYIDGGVDTSALHFVWIGNNDVNMYTFYKGDAFITAFAAAVKEQVQILITAGAKYIFVPNIYPKQFAPVVPYYYPCWATQKSWDDFGTFISNTNTALKTALSSFDSQQVLYYDVFKYMTDLWNNGGFDNKLDTNGWPSFCDGDKALRSEAAVVDFTKTDPWDVCAGTGQWGKRFWMQYLDMTSVVHEKVAEDMSGKIKGNWG